MKLKKLFNKIDIEKIIGDSDVEINNLSQDTRERFKKNTLYFAVPGTQVNGHNFINQAIEKGGVAVVCEKLPDFFLKEKKVTFIIIKSIKKKLGLIVSNFYENPSQKLKIIAVTGTNGKTTIATTLTQILVLFKKRVALFSTAGDYINEKKIRVNKKASTTMEIIPLHKNLARAVKEGCSYVCIEATSHALDQGRLNGVNIKGAIYTNITQDHIDYHKNFNNYAASKQKLFSSLKENSFTLINVDDAYSSYMVEKTKADIFTYGKKNKNNIYKNFAFYIKKNSQNGMEISINKEEIKTYMIGEFNAYNITAVYGALRILNFPKNKIIKFIKSTVGINGRMEIIRNKNKNIIGIIDYAHTPDAIENVLKTLKKIPHKKIITVIGAGGDRDRSKRPKMAYITQKYSDYSIFTSDNPRTEDLNQILNDMVYGCIKNGNIYKIIENREKAIAQAVKLAQANDIILIAGKGHENYQIIGTRKRYLNDKKILKKYFDE